MMLEWVSIFNYWIFYLLHDRHFNSGPFAWLFGLYKIIMPSTNVNNHATMEVRLPRNNMIVHAIKHVGGADNCDNTSTFNQDIIIGDLSTKFRLFVWEFYCS
jgi:hypothetical protein